MADMITGEMTVGEIVAADFRTARIIERYGIDFCCGGAVPLATACRERGVDLDALTAELSGVRQEAPARGENYAAWPLSFLADYIVNTHHVYLRENDGQIAAYCRKIVVVHGSRHHELSRIATIFEKVAAGMVAHLQEEEEVFFPAVKRAEAAVTAGGTPDDGDRETIRASLLRLYREHEEVGEAVHLIRQLSGDYTIPEDACTTYTLTWQRLKEFEDDLHKHVHLENNILFPKAAGL
jgi:regulator of cell morphogenesis and NO signaling